MSGAIHKIAAAMAAQQLRLRDVIVMAAGLGAFFISIVIAFFSIGAAQ